MEVALSPPAPPPPRKGLRELYEKTVREARAKQLARKARREAGAASGLRALNPNVKVPSFLWADLWLGFVHLFTTSSIIMRVNPGSTTPD